MTAEDYLADGGGYSGENEPVEIEGALVHETEKTYLVDFGDNSPVWLPKSQCTRQIQKLRSGEISATDLWIMPEWLAESKGLM